MRVSSDKISVGSDKISVSYYFWLANDAVHVDQVLASDANCAAAFVIVISSSLIILSILAVISGNLL